LSRDVMGERDRAFQSLIAQWLPADGIDIGGNVLVLRIPKATRKLATSHVPARVGDFRNWPDSAVAGIRRARQRWGDELPKTAIEKDGRSGPWDAKLRRSRKERRSSRAWRRRGARSKRSCARVAISCGYSL